MFSACFWGNMNRTLMVLTLTCSSAMSARAQSEVNQLPVTRMELLRINLLQLTLAQEPSRILPDNPIPVLPNLQDGPAPCPFGEGKSCALLGGRAYFSDASHMTQHDATWWEATRNPMLVVGGLVNMASTVADIEGTQACLRAHTCKERNPLFGSNPRRARAYAISVPMGLAIYSLAARLKKNGDGNYAFGALWVVTAIHFYEGVSGFMQAHK